MDELWTALYGCKQMPTKRITVGPLSGQVTDANGGAIQDAYIFVFDHGESLVQQLRSDSLGKFASARPLAGTYQIVVSGGSFTPLRRIVRLTAGISSALSLYGWACLANAALPIFNSVS